ncbi:uncharacterized protein LOC111270099 isoform X4 [Varroa jacobsoni]|uniref:uncharacterized protein LOC111270099 isoform X4 n=1 Tax=Varroa jacobsoni TaxID=62625 RepID=UPI000BF7F2E7|nr:uncharacterized protein LOC111270099 isoform X4 [Varroa jacobsoni]
MNRNCYKKFFFSFCGNGQVKTAGGVTILEKSMAVFVLIIFDACLVSSKLSEEGKVGHLEASDNQTRIRMPRQVEVYCSEKTIYLWTPLSIRAPQVLFDLVYLASIAAGEFLVYFDWLFLNITLAVPRPPKEPGAKSKVIKLSFLGSSGLGFRSPTRGPLSAALSTILNLLTRTFRWPAERIIEIIAEDLTKGFVQKTNLPL